jgi:Tfp pilus assembly protein PilX
MKNSLQSRYGASKGAALIIVLALVVLATTLGLAYFSRTTANRQLARWSYNDASANLLARSALDITVSDLKQEIANNLTITQANIQPAHYPANIPNDNPNLIRYSSRNAAVSRASNISSTAASANKSGISLARWNSHYLIPPASATGTDSTPVNSFVPPDWVLVTGQGPNSAPAPNTVVGRYAFAVYDEGGLIDMNLGGFPNYMASLGLPTLPGRAARPSRKVAARDDSEESEIMLAAFTPNPPNPCNGQGNNQPPDFTPDHINATLSTGVPCSLLFNSNHRPDSFGVNYLPRGLSINTTNGNITGTPNSPGTFSVTLSATNQCGTGTAILNLMIQGFPSPDSTPWPVNVARKGTLAFADLTTLPSTPTAITPTTPVGTMGGFPSPTPINKIMGWRNSATTQQSGASFENPSFLLASADSYARNFLGGIPPFTTPFTGVSAVAWGGTGTEWRTDQAALNRQELIKLQRTLDNPTGQFPQSLLQYLGTFCREYNRPAASWPQLTGTISGARWDMNNLALMIPDSWLYPGNHGIGHAYGMQRHSDIGTLFGLVWVNGNFGAQGTRFTDPNYYGHWRYIGKLKQDNDPPLQGGSLDFFQVIDYAMNQAVGLPANSASHLRNTFNVAAALIDQYDTNDLFDVPPGAQNPTTGNTITIIDPVGAGNPADYVYGIEGMSFDNPVFNTDKPPFAPYPQPVPANYALLNRRFENVGEFGYAYSSASTLASKILNFASATSNDRALLDFFTYNTAGVREGTLNLNTRNGPVLASVIRGALLRDPGGETTPTSLISPRSTPAPFPRPDDALAAGQAIVQETTSTVAGHGPVLNRGDVARLAAVAAAALPGVLGTTDETKQTIARALAETGQARTWNLMIDIVAQTGQYAPGTPDLSDPTKFIVQGEKRYWLHIALDRDDGTVLGTQLEELAE